MSCSFAFILQAFYLLPIAIITALVSMAASSYTIQSPRVRSLMVAGLAAHPSQLVMCIFKRPHRIVSCPHSLHMYALLRYVLGLSVPRAG